MPTETAQKPVRSQFSLNPVIDAFGASLSVRRLTERLQANQSNKDLVEVSGLAGSSRAFLLNHLLGELRRPLLYLAADTEDAFSLTQDLECLPCAKKSFHFPTLRVVPYEFHVPAGEILGRRISALGALQSGAPCIVVAPLKAALEPTVPPERLRDESAQLRAGREMELEELVKRLLRQGFRRADNVEEVGDYSVRGGLVDFFSPGAVNPVRIEFFDDTIESIRTFQVSDQRTQESIKEVWLLPRREAPYEVEKIEEFLSGTDSVSEEMIRKQLLADPEMPGLEWLAPLFGVSSGRLLDHLQAAGLLITDGLGALQHHSRELQEEDRRRLEKASLRIPALKNFSSFYQAPEVLQAKISEYALLDCLPFRGDKDSVIDLDYKEPPPVAGRIETLAEVLASFSIANITYVIAADNPGQAERMSELISDNLPGEDAQVTVGLFRGGFFSPSAKVALLTDHQIFKREYRRRVRKKFKEGVTLTSYTSLERGSFVVHIEHGIARFLQLETITLDTRRRDCLQLEYANSDKLYVPIEEFNRVSKYAGKDANPTLTRLGSAGWDKAQERAKKGIADLAELLVQLYAERMAHPGHSFAPDSSWMRRLEASFPHEETEDQQKAIDEVKADMERSSPTDRLICGDVGFGKTEVAVRASLKCVEEGKQVAILAPTTILAQQHFGTFSERLKEFPVQVELMSRFRSNKELTEIEEQLKAGKVDILIGTHRLLSKKVIFRDLGLLVIDEEQRFGVKHKERLRQMKTNVDTIALTATPIPRTLQLSLSGARDMSLITSSPLGRLPITTVVSEFTPEIIAQGILREVDRGGQVFFVHNRVQTIEAVQRYLKKLLPQVSVLHAHGQMPDGQLEKVMLAFVRQEAQMLLCTSIIESGLDIPNVNTIFIDRADRFGMAQLYQLRGRVGRSSEQAYCYLLTPGYHRITEDAKKRLKAIESHTELGSGFALAMRDLEIRGAGHLLGAKQSGFIDEIGFDMYTRLLEEAVAELKGENISRPVETTLELDSEALLPDEYIDIKQHKVDIYRRLAETSSLAQVHRIQEELTDRYGKLPRPAVNLIEASAMKLIASQLKIEKLRLRSGRVELHFSSTRTLTRPEIERLRLTIEHPLGFSFSPQTVVTVDLSGIAAESRLRYLSEALQAMIGA